MENITLIGIGRLGLCTALCIESCGYNVVGVDIFPDYVAKLNDRTFRSDEPLVNDYLERAKKFHVTTNLNEGLEHSDIYMILVDTPSTGIDKLERIYDTNKLSKILYYINSKKLKNKHIIICSTVFPGYISKIGRYLLRDCENTTLSYNPEFIAQGEIMRGFLSPDMVLIGEGNKEIGDRLETLYKRVCKNTPIISRMSPESAEICKLSVNCFITTKITFANMVGEIANRTPGANKEDILKAVGADSRIGQKCLKAGWGYGGMCFPRDNRALGVYANTLGIDPLIPHATDEFNKIYADYIASRYFACDIAYFENVTFKDPCSVPIIEESHKLIVAQKLAKSGKRVVIRDRKSVIDAVKMEYGNQFDYEIIDV